MKLLSTTDAAARLSITPRRICRLIQTGRLPAEKLGGVWVIREQDLERVRYRPAGWPKGRPRREGNVRTG